MKIYQDLLQHILTEGTLRSNRTSIPTLGVFGYQLRFRLYEGFPLLTTKKLHLRSIIYELLWFLKGDTNISYLNQNGVTIWDDWADEKGNLGPVYGKLWRSWGSQRVDQILQTVDLIKKDPNSRRILVTSWDPQNLPDNTKSFSENVSEGKAALPPCHVLFQFYVSEGKLSCHLYQRSADAFLGVPFNIASYALFTMMMAQVCSLKPGDFIHSFGDLHLYENHLDQAREQCAREPFALPKMHLNPKVKDILSFSFEDFNLENYNPHPSIKGAVAV